MADCSKAVEYIREMARMCNYVVNCEICPLRGVAVEDDCLSRISNNPAQAIAVVQKWSDAHPVMNPVMTWKGKLRELLRHADVDTVTRACCPGAFFKGAPMPKSKRTFCPHLPDGCAKCWNSEYKEAEK